MKCEDVRTEFPGLLFGEASEGEREELMKHISVCEGCREEWRELKSTEAMMLELGDEDPPESYVIVSQEPSFSWEKITNFMFAPGSARWAFAASFLLLALWLAKPNLTISGSGFSIGFGGSGNMQKEVLSETMSNLLLGERVETLKMVSQLLDEDVENLRREYTLTLAAFARDMDRQRTSDLQWFETGLRDLQRSSEANIMHTNMVIDDLIKNSSIQRAGYGR